MNDHNHEACHMCCVVKTFLICILFSIASYFLKKFLNINSFSDIKLIFSNIVTRKKPFLSGLFRVDEESNENGGQLVAAVLKTHDVKEVFTLCGGHISPILVACKNLGINVVDTRHEANAVFAADAVARLRQSIGVAAVTSGPGITNSVTALKNAQMAESPVLLLGGGSPNLLKGQGALQDIDQMALVSPLCKFSARIKRVCDIVPTLQKAIQTALSGTPGPVFVELPIDILYRYKDVLSEAHLSKNPQGLRKIVETFAFGYISWQYSAAFSAQELKRSTIEVPKPKPDEIQQMTDLIINSNKPVIVMGSQAVLLPIEPNNIAKILEELCIPVFLSGMSRGLLGCNSKVQILHNRLYALQNADLIILAGTVCDFRLKYGKDFSKNAKIIGINRSNEQLKKNHNIFWKGKLLIQADVGFTLFEVFKKLKSINYKNNNLEWIEELKELDAKKEKNIEEKSNEKMPDGRWNPIKALKILDQALPDNTIYVADGGDFVGSAAKVVKPRGPLKWLDPGAFGTLGMGGGFALGAKTVFPDATVVILYGDGAAGFSIIEFDTFVRFKTPIIGIIGNDACWTQISRDQVQRFNSDVACNLLYTHYETVAKGLGAEGMVFEKDNNTDDLKNGIVKAIQTSKNNLNSVVLNIMIGKTDFRSGSISI